MLFTGMAGTKYGYSDAWNPDRTAYMFYGEGQMGDMAFRRGNRAIRDHAANGKDLHLFKTDGRGHGTYMGQFVIAGHHLETRTSDVSGTHRTAIVFRLVPAAAK
jgi:5-methylcytosine-specific restriction protein A